MISPSDNITATVRARRCAYKDGEDLETLEGIINKDVNQTNQIDITPLVDDLEILGIFKDEDREEGDSVTDALSTML